MDKSHVKPLYDVVLKHATARDFISKRGILKAHARLSPHAATTLTDTLLTRMPLPIQVISSRRGI